MSTPRQQALIAVRGDDFAWKEGVDNLTTDQIAEAWFTVKTRAIAVSSGDDSQATAQVTLNGQGGKPIGITIVDATTLSIALTAAQTAPFVQINYMFDLAVRTLAGKEYTLTMGPFTVINDVTKTM